MDTASMTGRSVAMTAINHVLAPLDGTPAAEAALRWLQSLPLRRLTLLRVCEQQAADDMEAEQYLVDVAARLGAEERTIETVVRSGCPAETIVDAARGADLVVMSTGARGGGGRLLFGSVADRVARHSPTPALLIRHGTMADEPAAVRRLVVPLDGSTAAERAIAPAMGLARALDCPIHLITVDETDSERRSGGNDRASEPYMRRHVQALGASGLTASTERRSGDPGKQLLDAVSRDDLLVLTTHGRGAARRWQIGSVAEKLLRQATAPVVLVRADSP